MDAFPRYRVAVSVLHGKPDYTVTFFSMEYILRKIAEIFRRFLSEGNLSRDPCLRYNMDEDGYVPIRLLANSHRIRVIHEDPRVVLRALQESVEFDVLDDYKVRLRRDPYTEDSDDQTSEEN